MLAYDGLHPGKLLIGQAFRQFALKTVAKAGVRVAEAQVFMGAAESVGLVPAADVRLLMPAQVQEGVTAEVIYTGPIKAPITAGQQLAELIVHVPDLPDARIPLVAEADVAVGGFTKRLMTAAEVLMQRYLDQSTAESAAAPAS